MVPTATAPPSFGATTRESPDLVDRLVAHEAAAFDELVRLYRPRLLAVAARVLHRAADAEDALQESFLNVMRHISEFKRESSLETWMHRVVVNCALMSLRHRRRLHETALGEAPRGDAGSWPCGHAGVPSAYDALAGRELRRAVRREVARLPEAQRTVLQLHDVDGLELKAIAELLDVGLSTVKSRLHRAHLSLHEALEPVLAPDTASASATPVD